jgi:hypothetical protein
MKRLKNQKGIALVMALMMTLVLSVLAASMMYNLVNEKKLTANQMRYAEALAISRAGLYEAMARLASIDPSLHIGQDLTGAITPSWTCYVFSDAPGLTPGGATYEFAQTAQASGDMLDYTIPYTAGFDTSEVLTVRYKRQDRNGNGTIDNLSEVYFYDFRQKLIILGQTDPEFMPVYEIVATGRVGTTNRTIITDLVIPKLNIGAKAAVRSGVTIRGNGTIQNCGHDHLITTPTSCRPPDCFVVQPGQPSGWHVSRTPAAHPDPNVAVSAGCTACGCLPGGETNSTYIENGAPKKYFGNPDKVASSPSTVPNIWEMMGMTEAECNALNWGTDVNPVNGFVKVENAGALLNLPSRTDHMGVLWVKGDLKVGGGNDFKGLIYVEGDFTTAGNSWTLGAICTKGVTQTTFSGTTNVLYSSGMLEQIIKASSGASMQIVSQREID